MSQIESSPLIGVSSWAVHHALGAPPSFGVEFGKTVPPHSPQNAALSLLELPAELAGRKFDCLQICHFHLPTRDIVYLDELRSSIQSSGLTLHALLVDDGDVTHPQNGERDEAWIADWLPVAARLEARQVRIIAGKTTGEGALERSAQALTALAQQAEQLGITLITENWFDLLSSPSAVHELLKRCSGHLQFLLDFGNWKGPNKYENLDQIAAFASSCHAQAHFLEPSQLDEEDLNRCLQLSYPEDFNGPYILVNGELEGIGIIRDFIHRALGSTRGS